MISTHEIGGLTVQTGDILCMRDGGRGSVYKRVWAAIGALIPGEVDHCAMYLGPGGRFVEADIHGVTVLTMPGDCWDAEALVRQRLFVDTLVGVAYPLKGRGLTAEDEARTRESVAHYCLAHAQADTPFNFNLLNATHSNREYCSQLIADAYRAQGIELNPEQGRPEARIFRRAVLPEALWANAPHRRVQTTPRHSRAVPR